MLQSTKTRDKHPTTQEDSTTTLKDPTETLKEHTATLKDPTAILKDPTILLFHPTSSHHQLIKQREEIFRLTPTAAAAEQTTKSNLKMTSRERRHQPTQSILFLKSGWLTERTFSPR